MLEPAQRPFLDVARSLTGRVWRPRLADDRLARAISQQADLPDILGRVLAARGVAPEAAAGWLNPTLRELMPAPAAVADMERGSARLARAVMEGEPIGIIGDYDVDGMCATALVRSVLAAAGVVAPAHIPHRIEEGYGPSLAAVEGLAARGVRLLVTLDCGVAAHEALAGAAGLGLDCVVVDHHQVGEHLPPAVAVINPNRHDDLSGLGHLCAAGVAFILAATLVRDLRAAGWWHAGRPEPDLLAALDLVALATVCDVVPLAGLNRAYVAQGLKVLARRARPGLAALADGARLNRPPDTHALGFVLGPRLNAAGRVGSAMQGLALLEAADRGEANQLAETLERLNRERQALEARILDDAVAQAEAALGHARRPGSLVVAGEGWHGGVLGLVASRLKERFELPVVAVGLPRVDGGEATASGRSVAGFDLGAAVRRAVEAGVARRGGGHAMAAGVSLDPARLGAFRDLLEAEVAAQIGGRAAEPALAIDAALTAAGATPALVGLIDRAGPYGAGNPAPVFAFPAHRVVYADRVGTDHVRCTLLQGDGTRLKAIAFRALGTPLGELLLSERQMPVHVAGRLALDDWGGRNGVQLLIDDAAEVTR